MNSFGSKKGYLTQAYIANGVEHYVFGQADGMESSVYTTNCSFPETLLLFQRFDLSDLEKLFSSIANHIRFLAETGDEKFHEMLSLEFNALSLCHTYFIFVAYDWEERIRKAKADKYKNLLEFLPLEEVARLLPQLVKAQEQVTGIFQNVLDIDGEKKPVAERMVEYYSRKSENLFPFRSLPMNFELSNGVYTEVLSATSVFDLIDFSLRECIIREVRLRVCKHCGKYFAITRRSTAEYCELTRNERGHTCKEIGAISVWTASKKDDSLFQLYRKEYKRRFVWTKTGKITSQELYDWGSAAREKKAECEAGKISLDEFREWLKKE